MKKILIISTLSLFVLSSCTDNTAAAYTPPQGTYEEAEDCDFDDILERDTDCGFAKKTTKKPSVISTTKKNTYKSSSYKSPNKSTHKNSRKTTRK